MVRLDGGRFWMGSESSEALPSDGEGPVRQVTLDPFWISKYPVTNGQFAAFVRATGYRSEAEELGWSFVFRNHLLANHQGDPAPDVPWWRRVEGASWSRPTGLDSCNESLADHPVVHVTWSDAVEYCQWAGVRLPTEAEWEFAARGGMEQKTYPWGRTQSWRASYVQRLARQVPR